MQYGSIGFIGGGRITPHHPDCAEESGQARSASDRKRHQSRCACGPEEGLARMLKGAVDTMFASSLTPTEVMDLVPVKPLAEDEETIMNMYTARLSALYSKLKS